ncbi:MAG: RNA 2',3'-cyclic phosphodiesterase [Calditrichia bacterium]
MTRCFIAIDLPSQIKKAIDAYMLPLKQFREPIRFVKADSLHLTLKFLGEQPEDLVEQIGDKLMDIVTDFQQFSLTLRGKGAFPSVRHPKVLWLGIEADDTLFHLVKKIDQELSLLGIPKETRPFKPHLTIGRVKGKLTPDFLRFFEHSSFREETMSVDSIILMKSILKSDGAEYKPLKIAKLNIII